MEEITLSAVEVSPELTALWSDFRKSEILSVELVESVELVLLSPLDEDDFGACDRRFDKMLCAVEVSPDCTAL